MVKKVNSKFGTFCKKKMINKAEVRNDMEDKNINLEIRKTCKRVDSLGILELNILQSFSDSIELLNKIENMPDISIWCNNKEYDVEFEVTAIGLANIKEMPMRAESILQKVLIAKCGTASVFAVRGVAKEVNNLSMIGRKAIIDGEYVRGLVSGVDNQYNISVNNVSYLIGKIAFDVINVNTLRGGFMSTYCETSKIQKCQSKLQIDMLYKLLKELNEYVSRYEDVLNIVKKKYTQIYLILKHIIVEMGRIDWNGFSDSEKLMIHNLVLLMNTLYKMCQVELVNNPPEEINKVNKSELDIVIGDARKIVRDLVEK